MRFLRRLVLTLLSVYLLVWAGIAAYFSYAETHRGLLESNLSRVFDRPVTIDEFTTAWGGMSPRFRISGFKVAGDSPDQPAFAFDSLSAELSLISLLRLWPSFTEFAVERPSVEVVSLEGGLLQIAGVKMRQPGSGRISTKRLISWLMNQQSAVWLDGEVVWQRLSGEQKRFQDISFVYQREQQEREINASIASSTGLIAIKAQANGDVFSSDNWDAKLEVLGDKKVQFLSSENLEIQVKDGRGELFLRDLDVALIRDFIRLTGLASKARWLLDAQLAGRLHDVQFTFSGALLDMQEWQLDAAASDIGFESTSNWPAFNNLNGRLQASAQGGSFQFEAKDATFAWSRWYQQSFPITRASGEFAWQSEADGGITLTLADGQFEDPNTRLYDLHASCKVDRGVRTVSNFADLFRVESVSELSYQDGQIIAATGQSNELVPLLLDASVKFEIGNLKTLAEYLPVDPRLSKFTEWWSAAVLQGSGRNGQIRYQGELSKTALDSGDASLSASADFADVELDYGYQRDWPVLTNGSGSAELANDTLTITPTQAEALGTQVENSQVRITSLFKPERTLEIVGNMTVDLPTGMDFLFKGPLLLPQDRPEQLPIIGKSGLVAIQVEVEIPLRDVELTRVKGQAKISKGEAELPEGVPLSNVSAIVDFTERSVASDNVVATFLGGVTRGKLLTVEEAQPPVLKLVASGRANTRSLQPWVGEHLLTWFSGTSPWQGAVLIDGGRVEITGVSNLQGVTVSAPAPLAKQALAAKQLSLNMVVGDDVEQALNLSYGDVMQAQMRANLGQQGSLFDQALISVGGEPVDDLPEGVNFHISRDDINLDDWLTAVIDLAQYEPSEQTENTDFLDAMRSVKIVSAKPFLLGRDFGAINLSAVSVDGFNWIGTLKGDNVEGTMNMQPRADISNFEFNLNRLTLVDEPPSDAPPEPIDYSLEPQSYPSLTLNVGRFVLTGKSLGTLEMRGEPARDGDEWKLTKMNLSHNGIRTTASGGWVNNPASGSITSLTFETEVDEAEGVLDDMAFDGFIRKGEGSINGKLRWIGAPHEFDYARLNGNFDMRIKDGELVKVEPGGGKLLGLLNFNAIARRLTFDFRDVFASGLKFDRMQYTGVFADGEAIMRDAFIFTPAVFVSMEGKIDLDKELIDMEIHMSPELGGNLTLLSALANPTAGAVLFITQQLFKDEMRQSSFKSYRALGTWEDFEMVEFQPENQLVEPQSPQIDAEPQEPDTDLSEQRPTTTDPQTPAASDAAQQ